MSPRTMRYIIPSKMIERIVEAVAITTSRSASELLQSLAGITISHQSVISLKNYAGEKAKTYEKALAQERTFCNGKKLSAWAL